jgi:hypothetical protein
VFFDSLSFGFLLGEGFGVGFGLCGGGFGCFFALSF